MTFTKPARLLATFLLSVAAASAGATTITYSFSSNSNSSSSSQGIYSELCSWTPDPGGGGWFGHCSTSPDNISAPVFTGNLSFTVDASRFIDQDALTTDYTSNQSENLTLPWLSSSSIVNGPILSGVLNTGGGIFSSLIADPYSFHLVDYSPLSNEQTAYDAQGRIESVHRVDIYNQVYVYGEVVFGLIDGVELPTAFGTLSIKGNRLQQISYDTLERYSYDAAGSPTMTWDNITRYTELAFENIAITRSDDPINLPEPGSLALVALALLGLGARRKVRN